MHAIRPLFCVAVFCFGAHGMLPIGVAADEPVSEELARKIKLVESRIKELSNTNKVADFPAAVDEVNTLIAYGKKSEVFEYAVLFAKILGAVDQRLSPALDADGQASPKSNDDLLSSEFFSGNGLRSNVDNAVKISFSSGAKSNDDGQSNGQLDRYLPRFSKALTRRLFIFYRTHFAGQDDLQRIVDRVTDDQPRREKLMDRWTTEFAALDAEYDVVAGKLKLKLRQP